MVRSLRRADGGDGLEREVHRPLRTRLRRRRVGIRVPDEVARDVEADQDAGERNRDHHADELLRLGRHRASAVYKLARVNRAQNDETVIELVIYRSSAGAYRLASATQGGCCPVRILVIEDEARIRSFLARGLEAEGYSVEGAADGEPGSRLRSGCHGTSSCSTCVLPELSGLEVLRDLHRERPDLPVLVLSARSDLPTKLRGFELGAADYLPKPFSLEELLARVRVQLRKARPGRARTTNLVSGGRLTLDLARRQASFGGTGLRPARPRVPASPLPSPPRGRGSQPRATARGGLGLQLPPRVERRGRQRAAPAQEARPRRSDRDGRNAGYRLAA